jgi:hypothetical protein
MGSGRMISEVLTVRPFFDEQVGELNTP